MNDSPLLEEDYFVPLSIELKDCLVNVTIIEENNYQQMQTTPLDSESDTYHTARNMDDSDQEYDEDMNVLSGQLKQLDPPGFARATESNELLRKTGTTIKIFDTNFDLYRHPDGGEASNYVWPVKKDDEDRPSGDINFGSNPGSIDVSSDDELSMSKNKKCFQNHLKAT